MNSYAATCEFTVRHIEDTVVVSRALETVLNRKDNWFLVEALGDQVGFLDMWEATRQYHLNNDWMYMTLDKASGTHSIHFYVSDHVRLMFSFYPPHREKYAIWCGLLNAQFASTAGMMRAVADYTVIEGTFALLQLPRYETDEQYMLRVEYEG